MCLIVLTNVPENWLIRTYPRPVVLARNSSVVFHTYGYALNTFSRIDKSIQEGLKTRVAVAEKLLTSMIFICALK